jgi:3-hydroxyisobutyrate dehydrogenase-like beta-hydroxyacid dehydrogenase
MPASSSPRTVAVIGAGRMGAALIRALATAGHKVLVWNRDYAKAQATETWGARATHNLGEAVASSDCIVVCVADYPISSTLLEGLGPNALKGKIVIQLTTGSPQEATAFASTMSAAGAMSLDGAIMCYPKQVGTSDCRIVLSGPKAVFDDTSPIMDALGELVYIDSSPGSASAMDAALLFYNYGATFAFFQGISLLMAAGVDWSRYADLLIGNNIIADGLKSHTAAIIKREHRGTEATLDVHFAALQGVVAAAEALEVPHQFMRAVKAQFETALKAGHGGDELSAVFEVFRPSANN